MFSSATVFFSVYIPLVILAVLAIIFEEKLIAFEQKIKRALFGKSKSKSAKRRYCSNAQSARARKERDVRHAA